MNQNPAFDSSIPVLTEVVLEPLPEPAPAEPAPAEPAPAESFSAEPPRAGPAPADSAYAESLAAEPAPAAPAPPLQATAPDWDALELRIVERILAQLQPQLDAVVRNALASAGDQIHIGLRRTVEQMVAQQMAAVQQ